MKQPLGLAGALLAEMLLKIVVTVLKESISVYPKTDWVKVVNKVKAEADLVINANTETFMANLLELYPKASRKVLEIEANEFRQRMHESFEEVVKKYLE